MPLIARVESVTNVAEILVTPGGEATVSTPFRVTVANRHATEALYLGGPGLTAGDGFKLLPGERMDFILEQGDVLWAFAAAVNNAVHILQRTR